MKTTDPTGPPQDLTAPLLLAIPADTYGRLMGALETWAAQVAKHSRAILGAMEAAQEASEPDSRYPGTVIAPRRIFEALANIEKEVADPLAPVSKAAHGIVYGNLAKPYLPPPPVVDPPKPPPTDPPVDPPTDPPVDPPSKDHLLAYIATLPCASRMAPFPEYDIPTADDCDAFVWIGTGATVGSAYREVQERRRRLGQDTSKRVTIGIHGKVGNTMVGHGWGGKETVGFEGEEIDLDLVGLDEDAAISLTIGTKYGWPKHLGVFNLKLVGGDSSFIVSTINSTGDPRGVVGDLVMDGCTFWNNPDFNATGNRHDSGIHLNDYGRAVFRRCGPGDFKGREHLLYIKSSLTGPTWVVECDLRGGNRTGFQRRPGRADGNARPVGDFYAIMNYADRQGFDFGDDPSTSGGGSTITVWTNPDDLTVIAGNTLHDGRYGGIAVAGQAPYRNWLNPAGFPIGEVFVWDNEVRSTISDRAQIALSAVQLAHLGINAFEGRSATSGLVINSKWGMERHGIRCGAVKVYTDGVWTLPMIWDEHRSAWHTVAAEDHVALSPKVALAR